MTLRSPVIRLIGTRLLLAMVTLLIVSIIVFAATSLLPGSAARAALGAKADPSAVEALTREFGLDRPAPERYWTWISGAVQGDFGRSIPSGRPVWGAIQPKAINTLVLTVAALALLIPLSFLLGVAAAVHKDGFVDHLISVSTLVAVALPEFVIGTILIVLFAVWWGILPPVSLIDGSQPLWMQAHLFILPVLTLLGTTLAQVVRMVRAVTLDVLEAEYIYMVRLKGISEAKVLRRHVFPNVISPTIQTIGLNAAWLAGGVVITESVFQMPGIGSALSEAVINRDIPTVLAIAMIITFAYILINLASEILILLLNPRLRRKS
jgi:peptide/nickel transport system permease protein